jgi:OmpA-OmpF porin, OOP family
VRPRFVLLSPRVIGDFAARPARVHAGASIPRGKLKMRGGSLLAVCAQDQLCVPDGPRIVRKVRMSPSFQRSAALMAAMMIGMAGAPGFAAQQPGPEQAAQPEASVSAGITAETPVKGPEIRGVITARNGDKMQVTADDGTKTVIAIDDNTRLKASTGLFARRATPTLASLLNGLPITVQTLQYGEALVASQVTFRNNDFKTANMIRTATAQQFEEQSAATNALRGRIADIDQYNVKRTANVYFDTDKYTLSQQAKAELCATASEADATQNALLLVVGYTDADGDEEYNQQLSEKRAARVMNHLQQVCRWKPYRMLTPTGMSEFDPVADNSTEEGKAQNRRVTVNVLVSKVVDGL